ncbi:MAG: hypothetical protein SFZ23_10735 [Planctomycetota bacterium]|nr:hypothetical protein [Planctomycetota bacterium]
MPRSVAHRSCVVGALAGVAISSVALATGSAMFVWQGSLDNGATWTSGTLTRSADQRTVLVRAWVGWTPDAGESFAGARFDAAIAGAGTADVADQLERPAPLTRGTQDLVTSRFENTIKLDDARDTEAPGVGSFGIFPGQPFAETGEPRTTANPLAIFTFRLNLDENLQDRTIDAIFFGAPSDRRNGLRLYTSPSGSQNFLEAGAGLTVSSLRIAVPTPSVASAGGLMLLVAIRRRR